MIDNDLAQKLLRSLEVLIHLTRQLNPSMDEHSSLAGLLREAEVVARQAHESLIGTSQIQ